MQEDNLRLIGLEPADDLRGYLTDGPARMSLILIWEVSRPFLHRPDKRDMSPQCTQIVPQWQAIPTIVCRALPIGNRIAQRHNPDSSCAIAIDQWSAHQHAFAAFHALWGCI